jgi:hypothetical protein
MTLQKLYSFLGWVDDCNHIIPFQLKLSNLLIVILLFFSDKLRSIEMLTLIEFLGISLQFQLVDDLFKLHLIMKHFVYLLQTVFQHNFNLLFLQHQNLHLSCCWCFLLGKFGTGGTKIWRPFWTGRRARCDWRRLTSVRNDIIIGDLLNLFVFTSQVS